MNVPNKGFTHGGKFHSDDVFATALLQIINPDFKVERGFDVPEDFDGVVYDIGRGAFDHHQEDVDVREDGRMYAAFGLLWRELGADLIGEEESARFDDDFVAPLDVSDNTGEKHILAKVISEFNPGWDSKESPDVAFERAVAFAKVILENHFDKVQGFLRGKDLIRQYMEENNGELLIMPQFVPWKQEVVGSSYQFAIYPSKRGGYSVQGVPVSDEDRSLVCEFPEEWWGKTEEELKKLSGEDSIRFCHASGFLLTAETLDGAIRICKIALENRNKTES